MLSSGAKEDKARIEGSIKIYYAAELEVARRGRAEMVHIRVHLAMAQGGVTRVREIWVSLARHHQGADGNVRFCTIPLHVLELNRESVASIIIIGVTYLILMFTRQCRISLNLLSRDCPRGLVASRKLSTSS
jgi:hypothetical protein